ncbi:MAG TPA: expansin EXLX1 family cellulose-binding protein [Polyangia bacterium]
MHEGERDGQSNPVDGGAAETMAAGDDASPNEQVDSAAPDATGGGQDAAPPDAPVGQPDAEAPDASAGDLRAEGDGGPAGSMDAAADGGSDAESDAHPLACPSSPSVAATLQLANAPSTETACGYAPAEVPRFYAAVDPTVFDGSSACGACVVIQTPAGMVEARVVDVGPSATRPNPTALAVSRAAITVLAPDGSTLVTQGVDWHFTPCTLSSPGMTFKIQTGSNASYAGVLIENHRHRLAKVEYKIRATYSPLTRSTYNYWIASQGMGTGPFTLRMTDELGQTVEQTGIPLSPGKVFKGEAQFPACSP